MRFIIAANGSWATWVHTSPLKWLSVSSSSHFLVVDVSFKQCTCKGIISNTLTSIIHATGRPPCLSRWVELKVKHSVTCGTAHARWYHHSFRLCISPLQETVCVWYIHIQLSSTISQRIWHRVCFCPGTRIRFVHICANHFQYFEEHFIQDAADPGNDHAYHCSGWYHVFLVSHGSTVLHSGKLTTCSKVSSSPRCVCGHLWPFSHRWVFDIPCMASKLPTYFQPSAYNQAYKCLVRLERFWLTYANIFLHVTLFNSSPTIV